MNRRGFLAGILACSTPPGFVRAGILMPIAPVIATSHRVPGRLIWASPLRVWVDGKLVYTGGAR